MSHVRQHGHDHQHGHEGEGQAHDHDGLGELLDLDAEVLAESLQAVRHDIEHLVDGPIRRILDVGAGTGTGTFGLVRHFSHAHAWAMDESAEMLARLAHRAEELGLADRIRTVRADLDESVPEIDPVDLVWASASLHHLVDPERTLAGLVATIRPGGLMTVVELSGLPRFVPDGAPGGAAEARAHAILAADRAKDMPRMGSDWGAALSAVGLTVEVDRPILTNLDAPSGQVAGTYAAACLERVIGAVIDRLDLEDQAALAGLLDGGATDVRRRSDLRVSTERHLWIARREDPERQPGRGSGMAG